MRIPLILLLAACVGTLPIQGTMVIFEWSPRVIYLSADSLATKISGRYAHGALECKIHQVGDVFFTIVGVNDDATLKIDLVAIANQACLSKGGILEKESRFEILALDSIRRILREGVTVKLHLSEQQRISIILADRASHVLISKEYVRNADGSTSEQPREIHAVPGNPLPPTFVGACAESYAAMNRDPSSLKIDRVRFIDTAMSIQFETEGQRLLRHEIPRVAPPVCILKIERGKAGWVTDHQGKCPDIHPGR